MSLHSIPRIIHYCWFGKKPLPKESLRLIETWRRYMPGYEIMKWDESNFDVRMIPYTSQAYDAGKYAFVSDFARFWILYNKGGIYFDTDVELLKSITDIVERGPFMGCERMPREGASAVNLNVAPGLGLGTYANHPFYKEMIDFYGSLDFMKQKDKHNFNTVVDYTSSALSAKGLENSTEIQYIDGIYIYPKEYFCPMDLDTREIVLTPNTRSIHYYNASWQSLSDRLKAKIKPIIGPNLTRFFIRLKSKIIN